MVLYHRQGSPSKVAPEAGGSTGLVSGMLSLQLLHRTASLCLSFLSGLQAPDWSVTDTDVNNNDAPASAPKPSAQ